MAEAKIDEQEILRDVITPDRPKSGADFLTKQPKKNVLPNLFKILQEERPIQDKVAAIGNVRRALEDPIKSGLSDNIIEKSSEDFLNKVILEGTKGISITPSAQAVQELEAIKSNFLSAVEKDRVLTLTGANTEILTKNVSPDIVLEAVMAGVFSKKETPEFRQALFKTFLRFSARPSFQDQVLLHRHGPPESPKPPEGKIEQKKGTPTAEDILQAEIARLTHEVVTKNIKLLSQQADIRELERQLHEAKNGLSGGKEITLDPMIPKEWNRVLDVIENATADRIISHIRQRQRLFHPDSVLAPLEAAGIRRDSPIYIALKNFAGRWLVAINNAQIEAEKLGKIPGNGK